jgi:hypothetical protein
MLAAAPIDRLILRFISHGAPGIDDNVSREFQRRLMEQ